MTVVLIAPASATSEKAQTNKTWTATGDDADYGIVGKSEDARDAEVAEFIHELEQAGSDIDTIRSQVFEAFDGLDIEAVVNQVEIAEI